MVIASSFAGNLRCRLVDLKGKILQAVMFELDRMRAKTVGENHVGTGIDVAFSDAAHLFSVGEVPDFRAVAHLQAKLVEKRAPGAVGDEHLTGFECFKKRSHVFSSLDIVFFSAAEL